MNASILAKIPVSPCYALDIDSIEKNLKVLDSVQRKTGARVLLALKAFSSPGAFPLISRYLRGVAVSSLNEARLGAEEFGKEVHVYSPAYRQDDMPGLLRHADHIYFNSIQQWLRYREYVVSCGRSVKCGLRINPEHSEVKVPLYDPCAPNSRLGVRSDQMEYASLEGITGVHFHTLCELGAEPLERTVRVVEEKFRAFLERAEWINLGGGHHITRSGYDIGLLCGVIEKLRNRYEAEIYLEPGEAVVLGAGYLVAAVNDIVKGGIDTAITDTSAAAHMPDVLEMPYRPEIMGAGKKGQYGFDYRIAGSSCLAGDVIGEYSFKEPLTNGSRLVFMDMAHYTMVKNNTFNGLGLPAVIYYSSREDRIISVNEFGYGPYRDRLA
jgi:carboxynorspermidine decarboxylase